ncbi:MAG: FmdB family zinc ribbon protein [Candidatus Binatia bacterium]
MGGEGMPLYEFHCKKCNKTFGITLSIKEREERKIACPSCGSKKAEPLLAPFFAKTSKKS